MLEKHKNSLGRSILGIALCGLIGIFTLTKAPSAIASESSWPQEPMHFHFVDIPLSELVRLVFTYAEKDVIGLEQLKDMLVTAQVKDVQALDAAKVLLKCHGFKMEESGEHYQIVTDYDVNADITNSAACIVSGLE